MSTSDGSVYIGEVDAAYRVAPGGEPQAILENVPIIQAICEAPDGAVWFILVDRLAVSKSGRIDTVGKPPRIDAVVQDCAFDRHGELWATVRGSGMLRYREGKWEEMFGRSRIPTSPKWSGFLPMASTVPCESADRCPSTAARARAPA